MKSNAARLDEFSGPDSLTISSHELAPPSDHEALVELLRSPVHPADLNVLEGKYGKLPALPAIPGNEGSGIVRAVGSQVRRVAPGDLVAILTPGNWCTARVVSENDLLKLPADFDPDLAAMLQVNPLSAWAMLHTLGDLPRGSAIIQNAANSALGRCVIQMAAQLGLRTINLVRRPELVPELRALGADRVFASEEELTESLRSLDASERPMLGLNAVGGSSALTLANALADHGTLVTYGAMGRQPLKIPNGMVIFRDLRFRGFWLRHWLEENSLAVRDRALNQIADWIRFGQLQIPVERKFPLESIPEACLAAAEGSRSGKILLDLQS